MTNTKKERKGVKFGWKRWADKTPKIARRVGNTFAAAGTAGAMYSVTNDHPNLGLTCFVMGVGGKILSEFFAEST